MFQIQINNEDVHYQQQKIRAEFGTSQRLISLHGIREIVGSTFIQMGANIHGKARDVCREAEARQAAERLTQGAGFLVK